MRCFFLQLVLLSTNVGVVSSDIVFDEGSNSVFPDDGIDYRGCFRDLVLSDFNRDGAVKLDEYLGFVQLYGKRNCHDAPDELSLEQTAAFHSLACACQSLVDYQQDCCVGENAQIETAGARKDATNRTQEELEYLVAVCRITDGTLGDPRGCEDRPTLAPTPPYPTTPAPMWGPLTLSPTGDRCQDEFIAWGRCLTVANASQECYECNFAMFDVSNLTTCDMLTDMICSVVRNCSSLCRRGCAQEMTSMYSCNMSTTMTGCFAKTCSDPTPTSSGPSSPAPVAVPAAQPTPLAYRPTASPTTKPAEPSESSSCADERAAKDSCFDVITGGNQSACRACMSERFQGHYSDCNANEWYVCEAPQACPMCGGTLCQSSLAALTDCYAASENGMCPAISCLLPSPTSASSPSVAASPRPAATFVPTPADPTSCSDHAAALNGCIEITGDVDACSECSSLHFPSSTLNACEHIEMYVCNLWDVCPSCGICQAEQVTMYNCYYSHHQGDEGSCGPILCPSSLTRSPNASPRPDSNDTHYKCSPFIDAFESCIGSAPDVAACHSCLRAHLPTNRTCEDEQFHGCSMDASCPECGGCQDEYLGMTSCLRGVEEGCVNITCLSSSASPVSTAHVPAPAPTPSCQEKTTVLLSCTEGNQSDLLACHLCMIAVDPDVYTPCREYKNASLYYACGSFEACPMCRACDYELRDFLFTCYRAYRNRQNESCDPIICPTLPPSARPSPNATPAVASAPKPTPVVPTPSDADTDALLHSSTAGPGRTTLSMIFDLASRALTAAFVLI